MKSLNSCELLTLESLTVSHSCSKPGFGPRAVLLVVGSMPPQWTWLSPQGQHLRAKTSVKNVDTNDKLPGTFRLNENEWNWHIPSFQVHVPPILVSSWWQLHSFALHCPSPPSFLKMVRVQKIKKIEQPAVVTALLQDNHSWSHRVTPITSLKLCHRWSSQSFTIIHNHSQSFTIQHYPTLSNIRRKQTDESFSKSHQKAGGFPVPRAALPMDPSAKTVRKNRMSEESLRSRSNLMDFVQQNGGLMVKKMVI